LDLQKRSMDKYLEIINECPKLDSDSEIEKKFRERTYLHLHTFLQTLLERKDRISSWSGVEVRVPFLDHRLVQLAFNIPISQKNFDGVEKAVLRKAMEEDNLFPDEIRLRKKSSYPETCDPKSESFARELCQKIMDDDNAPIWKFFNRNLVNDFVSGKKEWKMTVFPSSMSALCIDILATNTWFEVYEVEIEI